jgi:hypothetical protein
MSTDYYTFKPKADISLFALAEVINKLEIGLSENIVRSLSADTRVYFEKKKDKNPNSHLTFKPKADISLFALAEVLSVLQIGLPTYVVKGMCEEAQIHFEL